MSFFTRIAESDPSPSPSVHQRQLAQIFPSKPIKRSRTSGSSERRVLSLRIRVAALAVVFTPQILKVGSQFAH